MEQPKKCALCGCLDEKGSATCRFCGEATWLPVWVVGAAPELATTPAEPTPAEPPAAKSKPKKDKKS